MAGCHHGCQCQKVIWDCVLEFAELGVLHTVLNLFIDKIKQEHRACLTVGFGENGLKTFESTFGNNHLITGYGVAGSTMSFGLYTDN